MTELFGGWVACPSDDELRRQFADDGFDDGDWTPIDVPGHWRSTSGFELSDGPVLYRRRFELDHAAKAGRRTFLCFDGLFYQGDVWFDGSYLGDTEGYFLPHSFEITDAVADRDDHVVAVELTCSPQPDKTAKRNLTGVFQHWDCLDPEWNPGGIWRPVRLRETGPIAMTALRVLCSEATTERARLRITAYLDAADTCEVELRTIVEPLGLESKQVEHRATHRLSKGGNRVSWSVEVADPPLWWPWMLGDQHLVDVAVEATPVDGRLSDRMTRRTGLRQVRMRRWIFEINGERLFCKGTNLGPTRMALAEAAPDELSGDVRRARESGLDLIRVHAHVSRPELYEEADRLGMLVWQDMPLQWGYARGVRSQATRQAAAAVDVLAHHPSVVVWCGHNEPLAIDTGLPVRKLARRFLIGTALPTWNKTILDTAIARALDKHDGTRPVVSHSGVLPHPAWGTDSHTYFGWYHGDERDFPIWMRRLPVLARWVSEFGAQAVPETAEFMDPERWPDLDWERLGHRHSLQKQHFDRLVPPTAYPSFDSWRQATQAYQAEVIRHHIEYLRRCKYRPTGGFCQFSFADSHPSVTWSVLDHARQPKLGLEALQRACTPVLVACDRPAAAYRPGEAVALDVHVVNDLRYGLARTRITATVAWPSGADAVWRWEGDVGADSVDYVGTISAVVPDDKGAGPTTIHLVAEWPGGRTENRYDTAIAAPG